MKKFLQILGWLLVGAAQILLTYLLVNIFKTYIYPTEVASFSEFLIIPLMIWIAILVGVYAIGILGLVLHKAKPLKAGVRFFSTAVLALIPLGVLIFMGSTVGLEDPAEFKELVLGRMVTYYTNLDMVFALLGFYVPTWFKQLQPKK